MKFSLADMPQIKKSEIPEMKSIAGEIGRRSRPVHDPVHSLTGGINIIAELKHSSPTAGDLSQGSEDKDIIQRYVRGGASAVSVLAEKKFFGGSYHKLREVCSYCEIPVLCKDFVYYEEQVDAAYFCGADMVLLINRTLDRDSLKRLYNKITGLGITPLVEIHEPSEIDEIISLDPKLVLVNMRNLETLKMDFKTGIDTLNRLPLSVIRISASGIDSAKDIRHIRLESGARNFLVGSSLMKGDNPERMIQEFKDVY